MANSSPLGNPLPEPLGYIPRMVMVRWKDTYQFQDYDRKDEAWPWIELLSCGFVLREDAEGIVIGQDQHNSMADADRMRHVSAIPKEQIMEVIELMQAPG